METIEKTDIRKMKSDIKEMVKNQKWLINQRKTVNKDCSRKEGDPEDIAPWVATMKHAENRFKLRLMYAAYGIARGKSYSQVECQHSDDDHPLRQYQGSINKILEKYTIEVPVEPQEEV